MFRWVWTDLDAGKGMGKMDGKALSGQGKALDLDHALMCSVQEQF